MLRPAAHPLAAVAPATLDDGVTISCDDCVARATAACDDCVVSFLCGREAGEAVVIDVGEARAMRVLAGAGLVPGLRHRAAR